MSLTNKIAEIGIGDQKEAPKLPFYIHSGEDTRRVANKIYNHQFDSTDIIIVGYPRSGTTWLRDVIWLINNDLNMEKYKMELDDRVCGLERTREGEKNNIEYIDTFNQPRILFTQLSTEFFEHNLHKDTKVICCLRNPKDTITSLYHASKSFFRHIPELKAVVGNASEPTFEIVLKYLESGAADGRPYVQFAREWWEFKNKHKNILYSFYEDMNTDTVSTLFRLADFIGKPITDEQIEKICEITNIENMKKQIHWDASSKRRWVATRIRKGKIGDWKDNFSVEHNEWYDRKINEELASVPDLKFTYE